MKTAVFPNKQDLQTTKNDKLDTGLSGLAFLMSVVEVFGEEALLHILVDPSVTSENIDMEPWHADDDDHSVWKTILNIMSDQGSAELRMWQILQLYVDGTARLPIQHRLNNNTMNLLTAIKNFCDACRSYLHGPKGSGGNKGQMIKMWEKLEQEYVDDPERCSARKFAMEFMLELDADDLGEAIANRSTYLLMLLYFMGGISSLCARKGICHAEYERFLCMKSAVSHAGS